MDVEDENLDSDEESERLKQEVFEAQKLIQESGAVDDVELMSHVERKKYPKDKVLEISDASDPAPKGSNERAILTAAEKGKLDLVKHLLTVDPNLIHAVDSDGYTALHRASYSNFPDIVEFLLQQKSDLVNAKTCDGWTPLHSACKWNNFHCAELLLNYGADINAVTQGGQTPLHLCSCHPEAKEILYLLLSNPKIALNIRNDVGELACELAQRHCKYYKLFDLVEPCFNVI